MILAQAAAGTYSVIQIAIMIVVIAAVIGLVMIALRQFGVTIPPFIIQVLWVVLAAVIIIMAIIFVGRIAGWA